MRACGILMPVFSLPGPFGIGTLGKEAFAFVDFLARAKQTYWQILPIGPTGYGDSPYQSFSAFAGNPYFIDFRVLHEQGYLTADEIPAEVPVGPVDYGVLYQQRPVVLQKAADRLLAAASVEYKDFCTAQSFWLDDYALFMAVKAEQGQAGLCDWPDDLRTRQPAAVAAARERLAGQVDYFKAVQFFFYTQWNALKAYANGKGIQLVGDIPIYVSPDSSDLWTRPELFQTDGQTHLTQVIAEDLGYLTPEVKTMLAASGYPGMKIMQFAFDSREPGNYLPYTYTPNSVVYTGTHDNVTTEGWRQSASPEDVHYACRYLRCLPEDLTEAMICACLASVSDMAIIPMADWLHLGAEARINTPSTQGANWQWRLDTPLTSLLAEHIADLTALYDRAPAAADR